MSVTTVQCRQCGTRMAADWRDKHVCPRQDGEPPAPWSLALARRRAANGAAAKTPQMLRDTDGVPRPYATALQRRAEPQPMRTRVVAGMVEP